LYRVRVNGTQTLVASRMFREGRSAAAFAATAAMAPVDSGFRAVAHDAALDAVYWSFPNDRKINSLPLVAAPTPEITRLVPDGWATSEIVAYAPEKTATAACLSGAGRITAFVKVAAAEQAERDCSYYEAIRASLAADDPYLIVPAPLACSTPHRMLWLEAIQGRRVGEDGGDWITDARSIGAAVARFHSSAVPRAPVFRRFDPNPLACAARIVGSVRPDLAPAAVDLAKHLIGRPVVSADPVCLHGDLHPKNALVCGSRVALLDVEDLATGPAACDLGSFLGALEYSWTADSLPRPVCAERASAFLAGYESVAPLPDPSSLAWYTAASLFVERAVRAITRIRPLGLNHLPALLDRASEILARGLDA
jgi:Ser/Thr protein kinase RdoA (MazF antagonist)